MPRPSGACVSKALEQEPHAFGESAEEHRATSVEVFSKRLAAASVDNYVLGAFAGGKLVGTVGFGRNTRLKQRHKARIWGVFVDEEHRGQGIARRLMTEVLRRADIARRGWSKSSSPWAINQPAAKRLYSSLGFTVFGHERGALKLGDGASVVRRRRLHGLLDVRNPESSSALKVSGKFCPSRNSCVVPITASPCPVFLASLLITGRLRRTAPSPCPPWY